MYIRGDLSLSPVQNIVVKELIKQIHVYLKINEIEFSISLTEYISDISSTFPNLIKQIHPKLMKYTSALLCLTTLDVPNQINMSQINEMEYSIT